MANFTPAPKPSQKAAAKTADAKPVKDDAKTGELTYTAEFLRDNVKKRKELIAAPDGTPGKDVALRVEAAAPIITGAVKDAKAWDDLHGKAAKVTKSLADKLARLRTIYADKDGHPDMRGQSNEYREAAALIYQKAGFDSGKAATLQGAVRYHLSDSVRELLRGPEFADGDEDAYLKLCDRYRLNPLSAADRQKNARKVDKGGTRLPALTLPDDVTAVWQGAAQYAHKALEIPGDADPSTLPEDEREALRNELEAVQTLASEILAKLGDV